MKHDSRVVDLASSRSLMLTLLMPDLATWLTVCLL